jgi:hypothetical protein
MVYNIQNRWAWEFCSSPENLTTIKQRFGNWIKRPSSGEGKKTPTLLGPLRRANLNHWATHEVKVKLRPTVSRPVRLGVRRPSGTRDQLFFLLLIFFRQLRVCYFVVPSLTRGWICNLLLLLPRQLSPARVWVPLDSRLHFIFPVLETPPT